MSAHELDYEGIDLDEAAIEAERVTRGQGDTDFLKNFIRLPERNGYTLMRILPRKKGQRLYCATRTHRVNNRSFHCPKELVMINDKPLWKGECIICSYCADLWTKSENPALSKDAKNALQNKYRQLKAVERYYYNVVARSQKNRDTNEVELNVGPLIYSCGKKVHAKIMTAIVGNKTTGTKSKGDITDPKNGRDFRLVKTLLVGGDGNEYPNYDQSEFEEQSPLGELDQMQKWLANLHDLQALRVVKDQETLKTELKKHLGIIPNDDTGFDASEFETPEDYTAPVREELVKKPAVVSVTKAPAAEEEILADEDFMKELDESMES